MINPVQGIGVNHIFISSPIKKEKQTVELPKENKFGIYDSQLAKINKAQLSFKGYYGDQQPLKKLFYHVSGKSAVYEDGWTHGHLYQVGMKKWVNAHPAELLKRTAEQAIQSICTLIKPANQYPGIPPYIPSPNFGDKWGRRANYIEINPRTILR